MSAMRPLALSRASKGSPLSTTEKARSILEDEDEAFEDDEGRAAEDIGKSFTYRNTLTASESAALERLRHDKNDDDEEQYPLPAKQRNVTYGDLRQPSQSRKLGPDSEALCIAVSQSGNMIAVGGRHGAVQLLHPHTLEPMDTIKLSELSKASGITTTSTTTGSNTTSSSIKDTGANGKKRNAAPGSETGATATTTTTTRRRRNSALAGSAGESVVTSVCFRPDLRASVMQNVLLAAQGEAIVHLHTGTRRALHINTEENNRINTLAMRPDGAMFASAGSDYVVRAYDEATCSLSRTLDHGDGVTTTGHTNHVFSLAWQPDDPQVLLSGGWDNCVLVWDLRVHRSVRSISGPHICGDALDVHPGTNLVLTGSWRHSNPLQLWDLGSGRLQSNLPWWQPEQDGCLIYAARFGRGPTAGLVVAGGSGSKPMVRVYKMNGLGNVDLQFTVRMQRSVHALVFEQAAAPHGNPGGAILSSQQLPTLAVCCDDEVHSVGLGPRPSAPA